MTEFNTKSLGVAVPVTAPRDTVEAITSMARHGIVENINDALNIVSFYKEALDEAAIVAVTDTSGAILSVNQKFVELSGYSQAELIGANHRLLRSGVHDQKFFRTLYQTIARGEIWHGEICNRSKSGSLYWVDTTIVPHRGLDRRIHTYTAIRFDITPQKMAEERLLYLANIDPLTGLPNRRHFMEVLANEISDTESRFTIGILDADHFKDINDSLGHSAGDEFLIEMAQRIRDALTPDDIVARLGGDEFAILLKNCAHLRDAEIRARQIFEAFSSPIWVGGERQKLSASLGMTSFPQGGGTANELLKHADIALYAAKGQGRNCAQFFDDAMREAVQRRTDLLRDFERGVPNGEFRVHYQPVVSFDRNVPLKMEALLRWQHPQYGLLYPGKFHEALLDDGLAALVDLHVLEIVLKDIGSWKAAGVDIGAVAINATTGDFRSHQFVERILFAIHSGEISASDLCVEINERMLIGRKENKIREGIGRLYSAGVKIAFDDFGAGFASLRHLLDVPVDIIKIDRSFISSIGENKNNRYIVENIVRLAHDLGKKVVAEGVETAVQANILEGLSCDYIQGFLVSPGLPFSQVAGALKDITDFGGIRTVAGSVKYSRRSFRKNSLVEISYPAD